MGRKKIQAEIVGGQTATQIDIRIKNYVIGDASIPIFYGYYAVNNRRIENSAAEGELTVLGSLLSSSTHTALTNALTSKVGAVTKAILVRYQLGDNTYYFRYEKTGGIKGHASVTGALIPDSEQNAIRDAVFTQLDLVGSAELAGTIGVQKTILDNTRYNSFGSPFAVGSNIFVLFRSGTEHAHGGRADAVWYDPLTDNISAIQNVYTDSNNTLQIQEAVGGVLGNEKMIVFLRRTVDATVAHQDIGYILSADLTPSAWGSYTTITPPAGVNACMAFGGLVKANAANTYYQAHYGATADLATWTVWLVKVEYSGGSVTLSNIIVYQGTRKITESALEHIGGGKFIMVSRVNGQSAMVQFTSSDDGATWSVPQDTNLGDSTTGPTDATIDSMADLKMCNGFLYCIFQQRSTGWIRVSKSNPLTVFANAKAWTPFNYKLNTKRTGSVFLGYPRICVVPGFPDTMWIKYDQETGTEVPVQKARMLTALENFASA